MTNKRITEFNEMATPSSDDTLIIVDVSDTTDSLAGTTKKISVAELTTHKVDKGGDTMTGDLVVPSINGQPVVPSTAWNPTIGNVSVVAGQSHYWSYANGQCQMSGFGILDTGATVTGSPITVETPPGISKNISTFRYPAGITRFGVGGGSYLGIVDVVEAGILKLLVQTSISTVEATGPTVPATWASGAWFAYNAHFPASYTP